MFWYRQIHIAVKVIQNCAKVRIKEIQL